MGNNHKKTIGFFPGVWDLVHPGHVLAWEEAKKVCDYLIVGLQVDPTVDRKDKNKPVLEASERKIILDAIKWVDEVIVYKTEEELNHIDATLHYDIRFIGSDHKKTFSPIHRTIVYLPRDHEWSSTNIRKRICPHFER